MNWKGVPSAPSERQAGSLSWGNAARIGYWLLAWCLAMCLWPATAQATAVAQCVPQWIDSAVAAETVEYQRPEQGWQSIQLPYSLRSGDGITGPAWFRVQWKLHCPDHRGDHSELALAISGIHQAGEVYWNDQLLWRSRSLQEPFSRGWNTPRWWPVAIMDTQQVQTLWVRVLSHSPSRHGIGHVDLGPQHAIEALHEHRYARQRTGYVISAALGTGIACIALVVWLFRRQEKSYFWLGSMQVMWVVYLCTILSQETWPFFTTGAMSLVSISCLLIYAHTFLIFTLRFGGQRKPRVECVTWSALALWISLMTLGMVDTSYQGVVSLMWCGTLFAATGLYFQWRAWHTRAPQHVMLAVCWLAVIVIGVHDSWVAVREWYNFETLTAFFGPVLAIMLGVLLGWKIAEDMRRIDGFNAELSQRVTEAQTLLAQALTREHQQALQHAKLQERMHLAHDLHDGLGGSLVRSMAMVEHASQPLGNERMLSMLKTLRDDLRQIIDSGSGNGAVVPATPVEWLAPLRHRVTRILDELGIHVHWQIDAHWVRAPLATQCLGLLRCLEETGANIIKHSRARNVQVLCTQSPDGVLQLRVQDDGVGFDVHAVQQSGLSVGMRSMQVRVERMGAQLDVRSHPGGTVVSLQLAVAPEAARSKEAAPAAVA